MVKKILQQLLGILILFGFLAGVLAIIFVPVEMSKMKAVREWPSREGTVTVSSITLHGGGYRRADYWKADIGGTYHDNGGKFWVSRVRYGDFRWGRGKRSATEDAAKYPKGAKVKVYYSPDDPLDTVLEPFAPWNTMIVTLAVGVGLLLLPVMLYLFRKQLGHKDT